MRKHLAVTLVVVVGLAVAVLGLRGEPDPPTAASAPSMLVKQAFPAALPDPYRPAEASGDAAPVYVKAITLCDKQRDTLAAGGDDAEVLRKRLVELLLQGMDLPQTTDGFLDAMTPMQPMAKADYGDAAELTARVVLDWARAQANEQAKARRRRGENAMLAVWAMGRRMFDHNVRLAPRRVGLAIAQSAGLTYLKTFGEKGGKSLDMRACVEESQKMSNFWKNKQLGLYALQGSVGDLIRFADQDEDRTFRIEALLQLGLMQWLGRRSRANLSAIEACLNRQIVSSDAQIAEAARIAKEYTREQARALR